MKNDNQTIKHCHGENYRRSSLKLSDKQAVEIRRLAKYEGMFLKELAKRFDVSKSTIGHIVSGDSYNHIDHIEPPREKFPNGKPRKTENRLSDKDVVLLRRISKNGDMIPFISLVEIFNSTYKEIDNAIYGHENYKHIDRIEEPKEEPRYYRRMIKEEVTKARDLFKKHKKYTVTTLARVFCVDVEYMSSALQGKTFESVDVFEFPVSESEINKRF